MAIKKQKGKIILRIPVAPDLRVPPEFERYIALRTVSDLMAIEAERIRQKILATVNSKPRGRRK